MSERQAKRARKASASNGRAAAPEVALENAAQAEQPPENQPMVHPAVVVMRVPVDGQPGNERVDMMELNGLDPLAVPTLLRVAATIKENSLGLGERK